MSAPEPPPPRHVAKIPLGPGRAAYSQRTRIVLALMLAGALVAVIAIALIAPWSSTTTPARTVTIPLADRNASQALLAAAEAVGFHPSSEAGAGTVEDTPSSGTAPSASGLLPVGSPAPAFRLLTPTGEAVSLAGLRGKSVLVEFFATWCPHCAAEGPHLSKLYASLPHTRYAFVSVNADGEDAASVLAYHIYFGFLFPALLDASSHPGTFHHPGQPGPVTHAYKVGSYPTFYVIDPAGRIAWAGSGEQPDALLRGELQRAART